MKPLGLLIANPNATTTSPRIRDVITGALGHELDLDVITTTHRGHAFEIATASHGLDFLITLGGDGTINETVNGMLSSGRTDDLPILATIPGGSANVMARALGFPNDALEATGMILESLRLQSSHHIGLGSARFAPDSGAERTHWFTINAGVGLDADVIASMEAQRAQGHTATGLRYLSTTVQQYFKDPERKEPAIQLERPGLPPITGLAMVIVQNTAPWTYLGPIPINPCPDASFDLGLDVFAPHSLGVFSTARFGARMVRGSRAGEVPGGLTLLHDQSEFTIRSTTQTNLQVDGDSMGHVEWVRFSHLPRALRIAG
ncbi:MAG: diacylglycerol kinase family protein [Candidatus Nanopelagicales bacterium]